MGTSLSILFLFGIVMLIAKIFEPSPTKRREKLHETVRQGQIIEARPRKQWTCINCGRTIFPGEVAYHFGDYPYRARDSKRTYICLDCVLRIQQKKA